MQTSQSWQDIVDFKDAGFVDPIVETCRVQCRRLRGLGPVCADGDDLSRFFSFVEQATHRRLVLFRPGEPELSFDERWLSALFGAMRRRDTDSYRFLLLSRMSRSDASDAHFLACKARLALDAS